MTPDMLMQPFEQSLTSLPVNNGYYNNTMMLGQGNYMMGYNMPVDNLDFRPTFYNPFEIKHRRRTSRTQLKTLEESFSNNAKPNATVRRMLAQQLDMTPRGVQIWFQNRRAKAKLLRRKSAQTDNSQEKSSTEASFQPVNNMSARSVATAAAASCILDSCQPDCTNKEVENKRFPSCEKSEDWSKFPLHPLSPVIEEPSATMNTNEWRKRSCPSLDKRYKLMWNPEYNTYNQNMDRRMTADQIYSIDTPFQTSEFSGNQFSNYNDPNPSQWSSPSSVDLFNAFNYSPISQQMTPRLSTGSPISVEGGYYDSCYDLMLSSSSSPAPML